MTNKKFISTLLVMLFLFVVSLAGAGCGGGSSSSLSGYTEPDAPNPTPEPDPTPAPTPEPTPDISFTVTFNSNGGSFVPNQIVKSGDRVIEPAAPTKEGYDFKGWYLENDILSVINNMNFNFDTPITKDTILYAGWLQTQQPQINNYTVTFDSNGGSSVPRQTVKSGEQAIEPTQPQKTGYTFEGWYSNSQLTNRFNFTTPITSNITLYAKWQLIDAIYTVTFNSYGGTSVPSQKVRAGEHAVEPTAPTRNGYTFVGWFSDGSLTERFSFTTEIVKNMTLYAGWRANSNPGGTTYTVTFNSNGGSEVPSQNVVAGEQAVEPANPTREGYSLDVWCSNEELTEEFLFDTLITDNIILYARWRALFTVSFNTDGGSKIPSQTVLEYTKAEVPEDPVKEGYTFVGWNDEEGNSFIFSYEVIFADTVLNAEWVETLPATEEEIALMERQFGAKDIVG